MPLGRRAHAVRTPFGAVEEQEAGTLIGDFQGADRGRTDLQAVEQIHRHPQRVSHEGTQDIAMTYHGDVGCRGRV
jgi:hypothetical protein